MFAWIHNVNGASALATYLLRRRRQQIYGYVENSATHRFSVCLAEYYGARAKRGHAAAQRRREPYGLFIPPKIIALDSSIVGGCIQIID